MIRAQFNISSFLQNGALLRTGPDLFNLITGPFSTVALDDHQLKDNFPLIYQPFFWDFLQSHRQTLFASLGRESYLFTRKELLELLNQSHPQPTLPQWQTLDAEAFKEQFVWSQQKFTSKRLQKTVPIICQKSNSPFNSKNLAWTLLNLLNEDAPGWTYGFWQDGVGCIGQTPELISEWNAKSQILKTAAVAGTLKNSAENENLIKQDQKIHDEHEFVVEDIFSQLQQAVSPDQISKKPTQVQKLKHILHLKTEFECHRVDFQKALQIIYQLHPTAALGLYPRIENEMQVFSRLHLQNERNQFAAPFAFISPKEILCVAGIRNLFFSEKELRIFSGCGVTAASDYEAELSELQLKRDSVKDMMGLFK